MSIQIRYQFVIAMNQGILKTKIIRSILNGRIIRKIKVNMKGRIMEKGPIKICE
jgi:hypothetical protein